jgi:hypothetical protein
LFLLLGKKPIWCAAATWRFSFKNCNRCTQQALSIFGVQ